MTRVFSALIASADLGIILQALAHAQTMPAVSKPPPSVGHASKAAESPQARTKRLETALVQAVRQRNELRIYELMEAGVDPNTRDSKGTPLLVTVARSEGLDEEGRFKPGADRVESGIIDLLVKRGAKIDARDGQGITPLLAASASVLDFRVTDQLLKLGANPNIAATNGLTPLMTAAASRNSLLIKMLLDRGAEPNARDMQGNTALIYSLRPVENSDRDPIAALSRGFTSSDELAQLLLQHGADVKIIGGKKITALHMAAISGTPSLIRLLLAKGADIDAVADDNLTPLFLAALSGRADNGKALISRGANAKARDKDGSTTLMAAASSGSYALTEALLAAGVDPSVRDSNGKSAADFASADGRTGLSGLLGNNNPGDQRK